MFDIVFVGNNQEQYNQLKQRVFVAKKADTVQKAQQISLTKFVWIVFDDIEVEKDFNFDYVPDDYSQDIAHVFLNDKTYDGICLVPKNINFSSRELEHRFFVQQKKVDVVASKPKPFDLFYVDTYNQYLQALEHTATDLFWISTKNIQHNKELVNSYYITHHESQLRAQNHAFLTEFEAYNGLFLCSKRAKLSKREIEHRFLVNRIEHDIVGSTRTNYDVFEIDNYEDYLHAFANSKTEMFWMSSANIKADIPDLYFPHDNEYDRKTNHNFLHCGDKRNGLFLCSKHAPLNEKEITHRFLVNAKEWDVVGSGPKAYDYFDIDSYDEYLEALESSTTEMFWMGSANISSTIPDVYFTHDNEYDRKQNHAFIHKVQGEDLYNGLFLCSKHRPLTQREVEHRFLVNAKEWDIEASGPGKYEIFKPKTYDDYLKALKNSKTEMFWIIPDYVNPTSRFQFDTYFSHDRHYDRSINHAYLNGKYHDGIVLCSKQAKFSKREFEYKFIAAKKEVNIVISTPKPYDIVFISYQEPNADENYNRILERFPNCKRVHGVKGIHQAHIEAAKLCDTDMFWIVDGDAIIVDDFKFDYQVARWDKETVHVWRSQNPINDMVYGYGGVKLFPKELTINMDISKPDMTTSISGKFKAVHDISNVTAFNTDAFNSFKSGFRECCKLSSKVIDRQKDDETNERLKIWCSVGEQRQYGKYAIAGAKAGAAYGMLHQGDLQALKKINDFDWLQEQFENANI